MVLYYAADVSKCSAVLRGSDLEVGIQPLCQRVRREGNVWAFVDFDQNVTLSAVEYRFGSRHPVHPFLNLLVAGTSATFLQRVLTLSTIPALLLPLLSRHHLFYLKCSAKIVLCEDGQFVCGLFSMDKTNFGFCPGATPPCEL